MQVLEHRVELRRVAQLLLHQVQVVVGEDRPEVGAQQQDVAVADEDGFDAGEFLGGWDGRRHVREHGGGGAARREREAEGRAWT